MPQVTDELCGGWRLVFRLRQCCIDASPAGRTGGPDRHRGFDKIRGVECPRSHENQMRSCLGLAEQRSAAISAEPAVHSIPAIGHTREVTQRSYDRERCASKAGIDCSTARARYWQSRHQQTRVVIGGSALFQRTAPQRHLPVTVIALSKLTNEWARGSYATLALPHRLRPIAAWPQLVLRARRMPNIALNRTPRARLLCRERLWPGAGYLSCRGVMPVSPPAGGRSPALPLRPPTFPLPLVIPRRDGLQTQ